MYANGVEANATYANYYLPVQHVDDQTSLYKKKRESVPELQPRNTVRILGRRYALTATSYKYLEIGITVGSMPAVEIVLGDNRGNHLLLHMETWKELMGKRVDIQRLLEADKPSFSPLWIRDLAVDLCKMNDSKIVKLASHTNCLYLKPDTMNVLFGYEHCIDQMHMWLCENIHLVSSKFKTFVNVLRGKYITDMSHAANAIRESDEYDCESLVDCEILACALKCIMCEAMKK